MHQSNTGLPGVHFEARYRPDKCNQSIAAFRGYAHRRYICSKSVYSHGARYAYTLAAKAASSALGSELEDETINRLFDEWWNKNQALIGAFGIWD